ncbi:MAG: hypothetical protein LAT55_10545 [Opitutales bacterium]|nr:hypothetical protein [Opitutales bacterium]
MKHTSNGRNGFLALAVLALSAVGLAVSAEAKTRDTIHQTFSDFREGELERISLHREGRLSLGPGVEELFALEENPLWRAISDMGGNLYFSAGLEGKVYQKSPGEEEAEVIFEAEGPLVRALALDTDEQLYIGVSPQGAVWRIRTDGEAELFYDTGEQYIWDLAFDDDGVLFIATGPEGRILRVPPHVPGEGVEEEEPVEEVPLEEEDPEENSGESPNAEDTENGEGENGDEAGNGNNGEEENGEGGENETEAGERPEPIASGEIFYDSEEEHITVLAFSREGHLMAGSSPGGMVYRFDSEGEPYVLFNSEDREIRALVEETSESWLVVTYTNAGAGARGGGETGSVAQVLQLLETAAEEEAAGRRPGRGNNQRELSGLYRLQSDGFAEKIWAVPGVAIHSLLVRPDGDILLGDGQAGLIFRLVERGDWEVLAGLPKGGVVSELLHGDDPENEVWVLAGNPVRGFLVDFSLEESGVFTSKPYSTDRLARWGQFGLRRSAESRGSVKVSFRGGNTPEPGRTWSAWSEPVTISEQVPMGLPVSRYFQYRLHLEGGQGVGPVLTGVRFFYRFFNAPPEIGAIRKLEENWALELYPQPPQPPSVDFDQIFRDNARPQNDRARAQLRAFEKPGAVTIAWQARDPDGDSLHFRLRLRKEGDEDWFTLAGDLSEPFYSFEAMGYEEGYYRVEVTASDAHNHPAGAGRETTKVSEPFLIDHTPPEIEVLSRRAFEDGAALRLRASDGASRLVSAEYRLNGGEAQAVLPDDGFFDDRVKEFTLEWSDLSSGTHQVIFRVEDEAGNARNKQIRLTVPE